MQMNRKPFGKAVRPPPAPPGQKPKPVIAVEQRAKPRKRTLLTGRLVYGYDAAFTADCTIADFSEEGARVTVQPGVPIPEEVTLVHLRETLAFEATVQWRKADGTIGLKFTKTLDLKNADTPPLRAMRAFCIEYNLR